MFTCKNHISYIISKKVVYKYSLKVCFIYFLSNQYSIHSPRCGSSKGVLYVLTRMIIAWGKGEGRVGGREGVMYASSARKYTLNILFD